MRIKVFKDGNFLGWIKSVSIYRGKFYTTLNMNEAKHSYKSQDEVMGDIDICTRLLPRSEVGRVVFTMD